MRDAYIYFSLTFNNIFLWFPVDSLRRALETFLNYDYNLMIVYKLSDPEVMARFQFRFGPKQTQKERIILEIHRGIS